MQRSGPVLSFIVPCLEERERLPLCLGALAAPARARGDEVLVVDGGSTDGSDSLVADYAGVRLLAAPRGRGSQMNAGAAAARGRFLVFVPADTVVDDEVWCCLDRLRRDGAPLAGGFRQRFDRDARGLRWISRLHNWRARFTGVHYGDQVPFVRRDLFVALGGFDTATDMEDALFGAGLRRHYRPRTLPATVTTSARRFERFGAFRATLAATGILASRTFLRRIPASRVFFDIVR